MLPIDRNGEPGSITIVTSPRPIDVGELTFRIVQLLFGVVLAALACGVTFIRTDALTIAFYAFCMFYVTSDNTAWMHISSPVLMPLAAVESVLPVLGNIGFVYLSCGFRRVARSGRGARSIDAFHTLGWCSASFTTCISINPHF